MIPLLMYLDIAFDRREKYTLLMKAQIDAIENDEDWHLYKDLYILESLNTTIYPGTGIVLPELTYGEKRIWLKEVYEAHLIEQEKLKAQQKKLQMKRMLEEYLNKPTE